MLANKINSYIVCENKYELYLSYYDTFKTNSNKMYYFTIMKLYSRNFKALQTPLNREIGD